MFLRYTEIEVLKDKIENKVEITCNFSSELNTIIY